jgi:hypothetical protein
MEDQTPEITPVASEYAIPTETVSTSPKVSLESYLDTLRAEQSLPMGLVFGLAAAVGGAALWALITVAIDYQIGYMAIAIGFLVGFAVRIGGKGIDKVFAISGALLALFSCLLGNVLSIIGYVAKTEGLGFFETLTMIDYGLLPGVMAEAFSPIDLLFYGIAVYEGFKFSPRQITQEELLENNVAF